MVHCRWFLVVLGCMVLVGEGSASGFLNRRQFQKVNLGLEGQLLDFTANHGCDNRIWSQALGQRRDLYVYLPPGYDPQRKYPMGIYLHGATQDEQFFLRDPVKLFDQAIAKGELPPVILAIPDGSIQGRRSFFCTASFFANTRAGNFEDFLMQDVWNFMMETFPILPEREAHALLGVSMGGSAAFAQAMKHKDRVKTAIGIMPALNLRWVDCHGKYMGNFDPDCWGDRSRVKPFEVIGKPGLIRVRYYVLLGPITGIGASAVEELTHVNPLDIMEQTNLRDGELSMFVAYGGKDEFNIDAQVESFLYKAKERGITITVDYDPHGRHNVESAVTHFPATIRWVAPLVAPYRQQPDNKVLPEANPK